MDGRFTRLAELSVHGANVQPGQVMLLSAELGQEELARAIAAAAYDRGAKYVDVNYFDPYAKRARIEHADPDTLDFVPSWYGDRAIAHAEGRGARVTLAGLTAPNLLDDLDNALVGRDRLPYLKEIPKIVGERSTNWCIVPCPHPAWAKLVHPELSEADAYEKLWAELEHVLRLDEPDPSEAWESRMAVLSDSARRLSEHHFDAIELRGPGTELTVGLFRTHRWWAADFQTVDGLRHFPNLPTEEVFTTPDFRRTEGTIRATRPFIASGVVIQDAALRFENGRVVEATASSGQESLVEQLSFDDGASALGELALVAGSLIGSRNFLFHHILFDENAASHIAYGMGYTSAVEGADRLANKELGPAGINDSAVHQDFNVGGEGIDIDAVLHDGALVPIISGDTWL